MQTEILKSWLESECNEELPKVCTWLTVNKLTLNALKSNCHLSSRPKGSNFPFSVNIRITDSNSNTSQPLEIKNYIKYIGVLIDSNPSWKYHVDYIRQKASESIGIIAKLRHFVSRHVLLTLYCCLILPYLNYGISACGQAAETHLHKLLVLQKRAFRLMFFS